MASCGGEIRGALLELLGRLLTPTSPEDRRAAEQQLEALNVTEEFGILLCQMTLDSAGEGLSLSIRQIASVLLKRYVDEHWTKESEKFVPPEVSPTAKEQIKKILPLGLKESISKIRASVAYTIASIASWEYPDEWPDIFDQLVAALGGQSEHEVQGAVRVLKEFSRDLTEVQIPNVAPHILPDMLRIFMEAEVYPVRTRTRCVEIFTTFATSICGLAEVNKPLSKQLLQPIVPRFTEGLVAALNIPDGSHLTDPGLKTEVLKALTCLVKMTPKSMAPYLGQVLPPVWATLTSQADKYVREVVNSGLTDQANDEEVDSDGEVISSENLVYALFEFVSALVETPRFRPAVKAGLADLMYYVVLYMQITDEMIEKWSDNPDAFVMDEDEDSFSFSVRISSQDLLIALCEEFEEEVCVALAQTLERHITETEGLAKNSPTAWKVQEAAMLSLGSCQEVIERQIRENQVKFDVGSFLESVVLQNMRNPVSPFFLGRALWLGSKFPGSLSAQAKPQFVQDTVRALQADQMPIVRISAVRAIWGFCNHLKSEEEGRRALLQPVLPSCLDALVNLCTVFSSQPEVLGLILENMEVVLSCDRSFSASVETKVTPLCLAILLKYSSDPVLSQLVEDIIKVLAGINECQPSLHGRVVPMLVSILNAEAADSKELQQGSVSTKVSTGLQSVALDILQSLVRASKPPLSDLLMTSAFPAAVRCTMKTDDNSIMQSGGECLRAFMSVSSDQICAFADSEGKTGLWYMVQVAGQLLNPVGSEFTATFVGRLVTTLIQKAGDRLGDNLEHLLKAVLSKLQGSQTLSVIQSLIMVYAHLINSQLTAVLNFLSSVPGPSGEPALVFVLTEWLSRQHVFYGAYDNKVSIVALSKLLQHGINENDSRLMSITVKGDQVFTEARIRTRSQNKKMPEQWTSIPVLAKILKLLINELHSLRLYEEATAGRASEEEDDSDEWEDDDEDENGMILADSDKKKKKGIELSKMLDPTLGTLYEDGEDDDDDPDASRDPVYTMDMKAYLGGLLLEFCRQPFFQSHFAGHLNDVEKTTLKELGI